MSRWTEARLLAELEMSTDLDIETCAEIVDFMLHDYEPPKEEKQVSLGETTYSTPVTSLLNRPFGYSAAWHMENDWLEEDSGVMMTPRELFWG